MGFFVDRFGARNVLIFVSICLGFSCVAFGAAMGIITLSLAFMCLRFFGQGSMMLGATNFVAQWFSEKRGFAMSILMLGFSASMAIHPKLGLWLIDQVGWRDAWMWLGAITWVTMIPLLWLLAHDKPEPLGLRPDDTPIDTSESAYASAGISGLTYSNPSAHQHSGSLAPDFSQLPCSSPPFSFFRSHFRSTGPLSRSSNKHVWRISFNHGAVHAINRSHP